MDIAIVENENGGGDWQLVGSDVGTVLGLENQPYLAMFGGNVLESTTNNVVKLESFDYWANNLFDFSNQNAQLNSSTERILNTTPLTSRGRVIIEDAIKDDLKFLNAFAKIDVSLVIVSDDIIKVELIIKQNNNKVQIKIINFKKSIVGDFWIFDFNDDFFL